MILAEILAIPGNRPVFEALTTLMREGKALAFVGAGASAGLYPMWGEFCDQLADYAVAQGKAEPKDAERWKKDVTSTPQQRVNSIVRKLGEPLYRNYLKTTFGPRHGADGKRYTPTHAALLGLPFRGYVTTNYDAALDFARAELRPDSLSTGTPTWQDDDEVYRWRTGDIFQRDDCPVLWLHGYWQRPDGIVLNSGEYSRAYKPGIYKDTFRELWIREHLVFLGFGFADPQLTFMVGEFLRDIDDVSAAPRHVAILGWPMPDDGSAPDGEEISEKRDNLEADYHLRAMFYPVKNGDHAALHILLEGMVATVRAAVHNRPSSGPTVPNGPQTKPVYVSTPSPLPSRWVHETTNDDKFTGREEELERLNRWVRDEAVHVVAVCAMGGTGKTALVGHWLKRTTGWRSRALAGLFGWSFYQNRSTDEFLRALLHWAHEAFGTPDPNEETCLLSAVARLLQVSPLMLVLDGLEVLQEGSQDSHHSAFLDTGLRELLHALCESDVNTCLAVLTSRFVFADLERYLGTTFHQLEIHGLPPDQGARLLDELAVGGLPADRQEVSRRLDGHPLALRVFAESLPGADRSRPLRFLNHAFNPNEVPAATPLTEKLRRLLNFYDKTLPPDQVRLLTTLALFRSPVTQDALLRLSHGLSGGAGETPTEDAAMVRALSLLYARGILSREPVDGVYGYACHPVLRDHFRALLVSRGATATRCAADLLKDQPSVGQLQDLKQGEPILLAIELLLEAGEYKAADDLYRSRFRNGEFFFSLPAPYSGMQCAARFVANTAHADKILGARSVGFHCFYFNQAACFAKDIGATWNALDYEQHSVEWARRAENKSALANSLRNLSELLAHLGWLVDAETAAAEALMITRSVTGGNLSEFRASLANLANILALSGEPRTAYAAFTIALKTQETLTPGCAKLVKYQGVKWADFLVRIGEADRAIQISEANLELCCRRRWGNDVVRCLWILGRARTAAGCYVADEPLRKAYEMAQRHRLLFELPRILLAQGERHLCLGEWHKTFDCVAEALALTAPRGMKLEHADGLVLRGRARLLEDDSDQAIRALDDATEALCVARDSDYPWAEHAALVLEADASSKLANTIARSDPSRAARQRAIAAKARAEALNLAERLVLTQDDLAQVNRNAESWLRAWEEQKSDPAKLD